MKPEDFIGKKIREYELTEMIGVGGMGAVYKAYHFRLKTVRAIKILKEEILADPHFKARFEREARILAQLENEHLIRIYEFFEEGKNLFLVMEFVEGDSMSERILFFKSIPVKDAVSYIRQACFGLSYAHQRGIVHRDLSPDNLMIQKKPDGSEHIKVIDFGIAKADNMDGETKTLIAGGLTVPGIFIGKIKYCSPEQAMGKHIDHRSDQYSLALILHESITGIPAFEGETPMESLTIRLHEPPPKLSDVRPGAAYPSALEEVIIKALQKNPEDRYHDILTFSDELEKAFIYDSAPDMDIDPSVVSVGEHAVELSGEPDEDDNDITDATEIGPLVGLTDIFDDFEESKKPIPYTGGDYTYSQPARPRKPVEYKPRKRRLWMWTLLTIVIVACAAGYGYYRLSEEQQNKILAGARAKYDVTMKTIKETFISGEDEDKTAEKEPAKKPATKPSKQKKTSRPATRKTTASSSRPVGNGPFLATRSGVTKPEILKRVSVKIPVDTGVETFPVQIVVQAIVLKSGRVGTVEVLKRTDRALDNAAMSAVKQYQFKGGTIYGKPADIIVDVPVVFSSR